MQSLQLQQRNRGIGAGQRTETVRACVGRRGKQIDNASEAGVLANELDVLRKMAGPRLGPARRQLVERSALLLVVLVLERPVQPRDLQRAVTEHMAVYRLGAAVRVEQPALGAGANEAHRDLERRRVERRDPAYEHVPALAHSCQAAQQDDPDRVPGDARVEHVHPLPRDNVAKLHGVVAPDSLDPQHPELCPADDLQRLSLPGSVRPASPREPVEGGGAARRWREQGDVHCHSKRVRHLQRRPIRIGRPRLGARQPPARQLLNARAR